LLAVTDIFWPCKFPTDCEKIKMIVKILSMGLWIDSKFAIKKAKISANKVVIHQRL
jgi:hypothetical protein